MTKSEIIQAVINDLLIPTLLGLIGWIMSKVLTTAEKRTNVTVDAARNTALTNAVVTYAGTAIQAIRDGHYTLQDVKDGKVTADLVKYLCNTVSDAMLHFNKPPEDLNTMLVGKINVFGGTALPIAPTANTATLTPVVTLSATTNS